MAHPPARFPWDTKRMEYYVEISNATLRQLNPSSRDRDDDVVLKAPEVFLDGNIKTNINPEFPYMYLPSSLCASWASVLPLLLDSELGLYIWNEIPKEAIYIEFTLTGPESFPKYTSIRIPLPLLTLTLSQPLARTPTKYFPCRPYRIEKDEKYVLGMALLQSVVLTTHWQTGHFCVGQAIGPGEKGVKDQKGPLKELAIDEEGTFLTVGKEGSGLWEASWEGIWGDVESSAPPDPVKAGEHIGGKYAQGNEPGDKNASQKTAKLAPGVIAGIATGAAVAILLVVAAIVLCVARKRRQSSRPSSGSSIQQLADVKMNIPELAQASIPIVSAPYQLKDDTSQAPVQLDATPAPPRWNQRLNRKSTASFYTEPMDTPSPPIRPHRTEIQPQELESRHPSIYSQTQAKGRLLAADYDTAPRETSSAFAIADGLNFQSSVDGDARDNDATIAGWSTMARGVGEDAGTNASQYAEGTYRGTNAFSFEEGQSNRFPFGMQETPAGTSRDWN